MIEKLISGSRFQKTARQRAVCELVRFFLRCELGPDRACAGMTRMAGSAAPVEGELGIADQNFGTAKEGDPAINARISCREW